MFKTRKDIKVEKGSHLLLFFFFFFFDETSARKQFKILCIYYKGPAKFKNKTLKALVIKVIRFRKTTIPLNQDKINRYKKED